MNDAHNNCMMFVYWTFYHRGCVQSLDYWTQFFFPFFCLKQIFGQLVVVIATFKVEYTGYFKLPVHFSTINTMSRYQLLICFTAQSDISFMA